MSTYWGYRCVTCGASSPHWLNHGDGILDAIAQHRGLLIAVERLMRSDGPIGDWLELKMLGIDECPTPILFLEQHDGHDVVLANEYGATRPLSPAVDALAAAEQRGMLRAAAMLEVEAARYRGKAQDGQTYVHDQTSCMMAVEASAAAIRAAAQEA